MNIINKTTRFFLFILAVCSLLISDVWAQGRVSYQDLVMQQRKQNIYVDFFTLPGEQGNTVRFVNTFRMDYSFLPFRKVNGNSSSNGKFASTVSLSMEIFKAEEKVSDSKNDISIEGLQSVDRAYWEDVAYADNYEQTQSNNKFISGHMWVDLKPGLYNYLLQLNRNQQAAEETSRTHQVEIAPYDKQRNGNVIFIDKIDKKSEPTSLGLLNFGDRVYYGKDFYAFVHLPDYDPQSTYTFRINRVETTRRDTTTREQLLEQDIGKDEILTDIKPEIKDTKGDPVLTLSERSDQGHVFALFRVPNSTFPNAVYQLEVTKKGVTRPAAQKVFRSLWLDMPVSLLNLDVAIDMLRFIESKDTINKLKDGSFAEREKDFREYWKSKDPTPETEYNELMAEYYRRIDYAYEHFTTSENIGYESDQGLIYIRYGPPKNVERKFPPGGPAVEIWTYGGSQQFVFEATSGFGDFKLLNK